MKKIPFIILNMFCLMLFSHQAKAQLQILNPYPTSENVAIAEKIMQTVQAAFATEEDKETTKQDKKKREQSDPKKDKAEIKENEGSPKMSEFPPYADDKMREKLAADTPSIPEVEGVIKTTFVYDSTTLNVRNDEGEHDLRTKDGNAETDSGTLERLQLQTIITYENARALARRTLDLMDKADQDVQDMRDEGKKRSSTGSAQKGTASSVIFRTHQLLNEIATLRNSYIEINAINTIQGTEAPKSSTGLVEGALSAVTGR